MIISPIKPTIQKQTLIWYSNSCLAVSIQNTISEAVLESEKCSNSNCVPVRPHREQQVKLRLQ